MITQDLPTITLVTPSFNQGCFLEATICSVLDQSYPRLEYIIIDGGSTDQTVEVIRKYEKHLTWWVSEKDRGQSHAINKGFARASGEVLNWLCSDDQLTPGTLARVAQCFAEDPTVDIVAGSCRFRYLDGSAPDEDALCDEEKLALLPCYNPVWQPSCYFRKALFDRQPLLDERLHYAMDHELWTYFKSKGAKWRVLEDILSIYQVTGTNKSFIGGLKTIDDIETIYRRYVRERIPLSYWYRHVWLPLARLRPGKDRRLRTRVTWKALHLLERFLGIAYGEQKSSGLRTYYRIFGVDQCG